MNLNRRHFTICTNITISPNYTSFSGIFYVKRVNFCLYFIKNGVNMIKITTKSSTTTIYPPKHWSPSTSSLTITLKSTVRNDEQTFNVEDESGMTDYFAFDIDTTDIEDGEYAYFIKETGEDTVLSSGLVKVGEWKPEKEEYNNNTEYIQYNYE